MVKTKGLGRGLDALLAGDISSVSEADAMRMLDVKQMQPGKYQPRTQMDQESLASLADSIKVQGIMQPILVRQIASEELAPERFEIIAGERRWRASQLAGLTEVPVLVREIPDESALAMALIENIQRENLNPLEEANGIKRLIDEFAMTHQTAAEAVGRSRTAVTNLLRLLNLAQPVQEMLMQGHIDMGHARALLGTDAAKQIMLAEHIVVKGLSVREAERLVNHAQHPVKKAAHAKPNRDLLRLQEIAADRVGAKVSIKHSAKGAGKLVIEYKNLDQLDGILGLMGIDAH